MRTGNMGEYDLLKALELTNKDWPKPILELASELEISPEIVSVEVARLAEEGLVEQTTDSEGEKPYITTLGLDYLKEE